jgi:DNA-binding XRE family transcriptional regulator
MRDLSELGLKPTTVACLHNAGIKTPWRLLEHTCRELIWHSTIPAEQTYVILSQLNRRGITLKPTTKTIARPLAERDLEILRLRIVEGRTHQAIGEQVGLGHERVRQILALHFGLRGEPPAVKGHRGSIPDCAHVGRTIQRLRVAHGLTLSGLAHKADIHPGHLYRVEHGSNPTWTTLGKLAQGLDTTIALLAHAIEVEKP